MWQELTYTVHPLDSFLILSFSISPSELLIALFNFISKVKVLMQVISKVTFGLHIMFQSFKPYHGISCDMSSMFDVKLEVIFVCESGLYVETSSPTQLEQV